MNGGPLFPARARSATPMGIAILGCGYVADFYMATLAHHPELRVVGAYDVLPERRAAFSRHFAVPSYETLDALLEDPSAELVLNLTNPRAHFDLTRLCLAAGKHVYSEKPLAMASEDAALLARMAAARGLRLASAPCSLLSETAQTLWKTLREGRIGQVRLVYANFDDGMVHRLHPGRWRSASGAPWPIRDEFETGCTFEHAAYILSWLAFFFGPARRVHAFSSCQLPEKGVEVAAMAPDFAAGCIEYDNGVVARVTCSIVAPVDKSIVIVGDEGVLYTKCVRNDAAPVFLQRTPGRLAAALGGRLQAWRALAEQVMRLPFDFGDWAIERKVPYAARPKVRLSAPGKPVDFLRGPADMVRAIREDRPCRLSPELGVQMVELVEALQHPERFGGSRTISSTFAPIAPLPWDGADAAAGAGGRELCAASP